MSRAIWPEDWASWMADVDRRLAEISATRLANAAIESGTVDVYNDDTLRGAVGVMPDGTVTQVDYNGPPPQAPSAPTVHPAIRGFVVAWDGLDSTGLNIWPLDFVRVDVHASTDLLFTPDISPDSTTLIGSIVTPQGGSIVHATTDYATRAVRLVARNTSGAASDPSAAVTVTPGQTDEFAIADFSLTVRKFLDTNHHLY